MPESIPKRGDYVLHEPTKEEGFVTGWAEDTIFIWKPGEKKQIPFAGQSDDFTILITKEVLAKIEEFLPTTVTLTAEQPKEEVDSDPGP